jgi:ferric-dicitrate binding protein FerR (iron transport regulator)
MRCRAVRDWLHRDSVSLAEGDRLILEEHLQRCASCRHDRELWLRVREVAQELPLDPIGPRGHQRAIARALLEGPAAQPVAAPRRTWLLPVGVAFAVAAAALAIWIRQRTADEVDEPRPSAIADPSRLPPPAPKPDAAVERGTLVQRGVTLTAGSPVPPDSELVTSDGASLQLPGARVVLAAATMIDWSKQASSIRLHRGELELDVDPRAGKRVSVVTERFRVEVLGTAFRVTPTTVSVTRGLVRVIATDGEVQVELSAGEDWSLPAPSAPTIPARVQLARARRAFAANECRLAEQLADAVLDASTDRAELVEARMVLAQCAQATGRLDEALRRYDVVVARFRDLPAAETALIATARLEARRGHAQEARARFERYLQQFPRGQFAIDARRYLER